MKVLLAETKLDIIEVSSFKVLVDSDNSQYGFVPVNCVLREYNDMKETIKNAKSINMIDIIKNNVKEIFIAANAQILQTTIILK